MTENWYRVNARVVATDRDFSWLLAARDANQALAYVALASDAVFDVDRWDAPVEATFTLRKATRSDLDPANAGAFVLIGDVTDRTLTFGGTS